MLVVASVARVAGLVRVALATVSVYLLAFPLTAVAVLLGCGARLVRWRAFLRTGSVVWAYLVFLLAGRWLHVQGRERFTRGGPYLVISNHASMFDIPALMGALPGISIMGRDYLSRIPVFGFVAAALGFVPINTASPRGAREALARAGRQVRDGRSLSIFAEGSRTTDGEVQALKRGFVTVLREAGCDLLPVFVRGTFALQRKGRRTVDPRERIEVVVGEPVNGAALVRQDDAQVMQAVRDALTRLGEVRS